MKAVGVEVEYGEKLDEAKSKGTFKTVGDQERVEIIDYCFQGFSMGKRACAVNLAKTPQWQRRGILIHKQPLLKRANNGLVERWRLKEDWNLSLFTSKDGAKLIQRILEWTKQKRKK